MEIVVGGDENFLVVDDCDYCGRGADGFLMHGHCYILVVILVVATLVLWWMLVMWVWCYY